jgi:hypothetical protein
MGISVNREIAIKCPANAFSLVRAWPARFFDRLDLGPTNLREPRGSGEDMPCPPETRTGMREVLAWSSTMGELAARGADLLCPTVAARTRAMNVAGGSVILRWSLRSLVLRRGTATVLPAQADIGRSMCGNAFLYQSISA